MSRRLLGNNRDSSLWSVWKIYREAVRETRGIIAEANKNKKKTCPSREADDGDGWFEVQVARGSAVELAWIICTTFITFHLSSAAPANKTRDQLPGPHTTR